MTQTREKDIVIDTNIFCHADNRVVRFHASSKSFLFRLSKSDTLLCIDEGFDPDEAKNRSFIASEYYNNLKWNSFGYSILLKIINNKLYKLILKSQYKRHKRKARQYLRNKTDRIFLCVTLESNRRLMISNDFIDFQISKRKRLKKDLEVIILASNQTTS